MMKRFLISICLIVSSFSLLAGCSSVLEKEKKDTIDVLVPYAEGHGLSDDIANAMVPETRNSEPVTNVGMGEITTAASEEE